MFVCYQILVFFLVSSWASFLTVVAERTLDGEAFWRSRSHCPHCQQVIPLHQLLPIFGYCLAHGRCHFCQAAIPWCYPLFEFLFPLIVALLAAQGKLSWWVFLLISVLFTMAMADCYQQWVPDRFQVILLLLCLYKLSQLPLGGTQIQQLLFAAVVFLGLNFLSLQTGQGLGGADIKILTSLALCWPLLPFLWLILLACLSAFPAFLFLSFRKAAEKHALPFVPFLWLAAIGLLLYF